MQHEYSAGPHEGALKGALDMFLKEALSEPSKEPLWGI